MNAMVDTITDAVEIAIARESTHQGGVRRFALQGAVRRALRDIHDHRTPLHRKNGDRGHGCSPMPPGQRQYATGICPRHGPAVFVRRLEAAMPPPVVPKTPAIPKIPTAPRPLERTLLSFMPRPRSGSGGAPPLTAARVGSSTWPPGLLEELAAVAAGHVGDGDGAQRGLPRGGGVGHEELLRVDGVA